MNHHAPTKDKITVSLSLDAISALAQLTTERKRGEFISTMILDAQRRAQSPPTNAITKMRALLDQLENE